MSTLEFILDVLDTFAKEDMCNEIWWRTDSPDYNPITFIVTCNDFFGYASADAEIITPENLPILKQSMKDCTDSKGHCSEESILLFCARVRNRKPLDAYLSETKHKLMYFNLFNNLGPN